jgi:hypothetical protein
MDQWLLNKDVDRAIELLQYIREAHNNNKNGFNLKQYKEWAELRDIVDRLKDSFFDTSELDKGE